ncbi:hypothetical protein VFPFJ_02752 [Purpureocillium lilacinum]|uniref:Uncharacterized protein n=1 Tax=Purpureocillium lilacinum TaxID=33203 RepID=A0A179GLA4_PURLI|nr:hypothetical protein VFPFJ_02752 [Purpureocillium lilacinum]OAQ78666.1 hypothetical protein VFPBJ_06787 [Purpureocillium lilacinum]OAQ93590.1 hypothetical protein VFPFJ_02752 [Purpureocillium lilacinum]
MRWDEEERSRRPFLGYVKGGRRTRSQGVGEVYTTLMSYMPKMLSPLSRCLVIIRWACSSRGVRHFESAIRPRAGSSTRLQPGTGQ